MVILIAEIIPLGYEFPKPGEPICSLRTGSFCFCAGDSPTSINVRRTIQGVLVMRTWPCPTSHLVRKHLAQRQHTHSSRKL